MFYAIASIIALIALSIVGSPLARMVMPICFACVVLVTEPEML